MSKAARTLIGKVINDVRNKTVTVLVEHRVKHSLYGKIVKRFKKYHAHDENNKYKNGDNVVIVETKKLSKTKSWCVDSLLNNSN